MDGRYQRVFGAPGARGLIGASLLSRIPIGIGSIALVLFVHDATGSYGSAGAVTATYAISAALLAVGMGRIIDRRGQTVVILGALVVHATGMGLLIVSGLAGAGTPVLIACAALAGALPPVSAALRPLWTELLGDDQELLTSAYAVDAILLDIVFFVGPLLTGVLVALFSPAVPLIVGLAMMIVGALWFAASPVSRGWRGTGDRASHFLGALISPGLRTLLAGSVGLGVCFGALEVSLAAYGNDEGIAGLAGGLIALQSIGSMIAGLWYGANAHRLGSIQRRVLVLLIVLPVTIAPLIVAPGLWAVVPLAVLSGCVIAPLMATQNMLTGDLAPRGALTEAFTWTYTALIVGVATGNAVAGIVVDASSWRIAILVAVVVAAIGTIVTLLWRRTLYPAAEVNGAPAAA